jgi:hypothetical protein
MVTTVLLYKGTEYVGYSFNLTDEGADGAADKWAKVNPGVNKAIVNYSDGTNKEFIVSEVLEITEITEITESNDEEIKIDKRVGKSKSLA